MNALVCSYADMGCTFQCTTLDEMRAHDTVALQDHLHLVTASVRSPEWSMMANAVRQSYDLVMTIWAGAEASSLVPTEQVDHALPITNKEVEDDDDDDDDDMILVEPEVILERNKKPSRARNGPSPTVIPELDCKVSMFLDNLWQMVHAEHSFIEWRTDASTGCDYLFIRDRVRFARSTLPLYFRHDNFSSFVRQLHFYGFRVHRSANDTWYHPLFTRSGQHVGHMARQKK